MAISVLLGQFSQSGFNSAVERYFATVHLVPLRAGIQERWRGAPPVVCLCFAISTCHRVPEQYAIAPSHERDLSRARLRRMSISTPVQLAPQTGAVLLPAGEPPFRHVRTPQRRASSQAPSRARRSPPPRWSPATRRRQAINACSQGPGEMLGRRLPRRPAGCSIRIHRGVL